MAATPDALLRPVSTLRVLIIFLSISSSADADPAAVNPQLTALLAVAKALGNPKILTQSWQGDEFCHNWEFITCTDPDQQRNVTAIDFSNQRFTGTISPAFANLTSLKSLHLNGNNLTGSIPDILGTLPHLQFIDVSNNNLSGELPVFSSSITIIASGNVYLTVNVCSAAVKPNGSSGKLIAIYVVWVIGVVACLVFLGAVVFMACNCLNKQHYQTSPYFMPAVVIAVSALLVFVGSDICLHIGVFT